LSGETAFALMNTAEHCPKFLPFSKTATVSFPAKALQSMHALAETSNTPFIKQVI
jgi:hypothetical protein